MINQIILDGYLGDYPKELQSGAAVIRLATTDRGFITKDGRQVPDRTTWHTCYVYGSNATFILKAAIKGSRVCLRGRYICREYEDETGTRRQFWQVETENVFSIDKPAHLTNPDVLPKAMPEAFRAMAQRGAAAESTPSTGEGAQAEQAKPAPF